MKVHMRRNRQALSRRQCDEILEKGTHGVLALCGADGEPYALPISYAQRDGDIIFHCAKSGKKLDIIKENNLASFCVVAMDRVVPERFTTYFKSVIVSGRIEIVDDEAEKMRLIKTIAAKYSPLETPRRVDEEIRAGRPGLCILKMTPDEISGKQAKELMNKEKGE